MKAITPCGNAGIRKCIGADPSEPAQAETGPKKFAEPVALSSTAHADLPLESCDSPVLPSCSASTYLRSVLGARRTLRGCKRRCKWGRGRKGRNLRNFNNQHFHSHLPNLWRGL